MDRAWAQQKIKLRIKIFSEKISRVVEFIRPKFEYFVGAEFDFDQHKWVWMDTNIEVPLVRWLKRFAEMTDVMLPPRLELIRTDYNNLFSRQFNDFEDEHHPRVNDKLVKNGFHLNHGEKNVVIKIENAVPMMSKNYTADYFCEDKRTIGYSATFEQANKHCNDLGLEISFSPGILKQRLQPRLFNNPCHRSKYNISARHEKRRSPSRIHQPS